MILFPFTAIVGMEQAKRSLIYHAIEPKIGGTLLLGHRGCAKSTLVRAFADILSSTSEASAPFVEVPLGTSEDRLLGSVNAELLVEQNKWQGSPGLFESANGGVLYVDEINLLPDHLSDYILDSAASGHYRMERDGFTRVVESRYILVGTMNPEEGDLRPQLCDRFAHGVQVQDAFSTEERMEIVQRRIRFDIDPDEFVREFATATSDLKERIKAAQSRLREARISREMRMEVASRGRDLKLEGIRAELAVVRTALCAAAWNGRLEVLASDLEEAWALCLGHRHPDTHQPPNPPPNHKQPDAAPTPGKPPFGGFTPQSPLDSKTDAKPVAQALPTVDHRLQAWWQKPRPWQPMGKEQTCGYSQQPQPPIAWIETVIASARARGQVKTGAKQLQMRYGRRATRKNLWCFLDASRSTGASRFLGDGRDTLLALAQSAKSARFNLLVLQEGQTKWAAKSCTFQKFQSALLSLHKASGKSLIIEGLKTLHRAKLKQATHSIDRIVIVSDGLASPLSGEKPCDTLRRLRSRLGQILRTKSPVAWVYQQPKRGLSRWLPTVFKGLDIEQVECRP